MNFLWGQSDICTAMEKNGQKALRTSLVFRRSTKVLRVLERHEG